MRGVVGRRRVGRWARAGGLGRGGQSLRVVVELVRGACQLLHQVHEVVAGCLQHCGGYLLGWPLALLLLARALGGFRVEDAHVVACHRGVESE